MLVWPSQAGLQKIIKPKTVAAKISTAMKELYNSNSFDAFSMLCCITSYWTRTYTYPQIRITKQEW
jgi:hypothetical protein